MHVAVVEVEVHIPASRSLKEKRAVVRPIVEGMRHRFGVSVAEVAWQDKWQRARIAFAVVSGSYSHATELVASIERWVWAHPDLEVSRFELGWYERSGDGGSVD